MTWSTAAPLAQDDGGPEWSDCQSPSWKSVSASSGKVPSGVLMLRRQRSEGQDQMRVHLWACKPGAPSGQILLSAQAGPSSDLTATSRVLIAPAAYWKWMGSLRITTVSLQP